MYISPDVRIYFHLPGSRKSNFFERLKAREQSVPFAHPHCRHKSTADTSTEKQWSHTHILTGAIGSLPVVLFCLRKMQFHACSFVQVFMLLVIVCIHKHAFRCLCVDCLQRFIHSVVLNARCTHTHSSPSAPRPFRGVDIEQNATSSSSFVRVSRAMPQQTGFFPGATPPS